MDYIATAVWLYFGVLVILNVLDWFTTTLLMMHFKRLGPEEGMLPLWKTTRPGKWMIRRGWAKPAGWGTIHWYDHELNPWFRKGLKHFGIHVLTVGKVVPLVGMTFVVTDTVNVAPLGFNVGIIGVLLGLNILYIWVVINNSMVILRCLSARTAKGG